MIKIKSSFLFLFTFLAFPFSAFATTTVPFVLVDYGGDQWGSEASYYANNWNLYDLSDTFVQGSVGSAIDPCFIDLTGVPADTYYIRCEDFTSQIEYLSDNFMWNGFELLGGGGESTRILSINPFAESTIGTTTSGVLGATVLRGLNDENEQLVLKIRYVLNSDLQAAVASPTLLYKSFEWVIDEELASFSYSTTTSFLREGEYTMITSVQKVGWLNTSLDFVFGGLFEPGVVAATTTKFTVVAPTNFDIYFGLDMYQHLASTTPFYEACKISSLNLSDCIAGIFYWDSIEMGKVFEKTKTELFRTWPLGYVSRVLDILNSSTTATTTSDLVIAFSFPDSLGEFAGDAVSFNFTQAARDADDLLRTEFVMKTGSDKNIWDIVMPILWTIFAIAYVVWLIKYIMGIRNLSGGSRMFGKGEKRSGLMSDEYRYKVKLYELSKRR